MAELTVQRVAKRLATTQAAIRRASLYYEHQVYKAHGIKAIQRQSFLDAAGEIGGAGSDLLDRGNPVSEEVPGTSTSADGGGTEARAAESRWGEDTPSLFDPDYQQQAEQDQARYEGKLTKDRLQAQFNAPITQSEQLQKKQIKRAKPVQQLGMFDENEPRRPTA